MSDGGWGGDCGGFGGWYGGYDGDDDDGGCGSGNGGGCQLPSFVTAAIEAAGAANCDMPIGSGVADGAWGHINLAGIGAILQVRR